MVSISALYSESMSITIKVAQIRTAPSFLGKVIYRLNYANKVNVLESKQGWAYVQTNENNEKGWVHLSALTEKDIVLNTNSADIGMSASNSEVALAGKGFSSEVEESYKGNNHIDYTWIDKMESFNIETEQVVLFLEEVNK